ncbi:hypothetical protein WA026_014814 [Henosepilachna vigintioctopunctata]|uniref:Cytoplasmic tRNA 2-thiolation protein 2 n=1 Tax=Henosepilachna vigintioctopunctata TaxID=420089 RepID=A0AAW1UT80_9CUCU
MCSVNDAGDIEDLNNTGLLSNFKYKVLAEKCNKCKDEKPCVILRKKDAYCKSCFLTSTVHKFKALLGKHKLIKDGDKVLVYYHGGHSGTALLHFLRTNLDLNSPKKLRFIPVCLFIEKHYFLSREERIDNLRRIFNYMRTFDIPIYFTSLTDYCKNGFSENTLLTKNFEELELDNKEGEFMKDLFEKSESLANDVQTINIRKLLISCAKKLKCKFIFTPELATDIASQLLVNTALGRGSHIPLDTGFCDTRNEHVTILRPLRVFDIKELALYNHFCNLDAIMLQTDLPKSQKSIQNLIENFVIDLQTNFPATVTTVLKTGDKLSMKKNKNENRICYICQSPIEVACQQLTTDEAIKYSHQISTQPELVGGDILKDNFGTVIDTKTCFSCSRIEQFLISTSTEKV